MALFKSSSDKDYSGSCFGKSRLKTVVTKEKAQDQHKLIMSVTENDSSAIFLIKNLASPGKHFKINGEKVIALIFAKD